MIRIFKQAKIVLFVISILITTTTYSRNYYVSTDGNDDDQGTTEEPFKTINKGVEVAQAGDVVIVKSGTYKPSVKIRPLNSGTETAPITIMSEVKNGAIIDGQLTVPTSSSREGLFYVFEKSWIVIDGFRLINSGFFGFLIKNSSNVTVQNCSTYMTYASGICGANSSNIKALNNTIEKACMYPSKSMNTSECITMASVNGFEVAYNTVSNRLTDPSNGGEGIDAKNECTNGKIHHNTVFDLYRLGIYADAYSKPLTNVEVYANTVYNCSSGIVVVSEEGGTAVGIKVYDNVVYDCSGVGIRLAGYLNNGPLQDVDVYQNTVVRCGLNAGSWLNSGILVEATNVNNRNFVIRNNILSGNANQIRINGQNYLTIDNNLLHGSSYTTGTNSIQADPLFQNSSENNFRLEEDSPAIDKAAGFPQSNIDHDNVLRPIDGDLDGISASDLGAYEYSPTAGDTKIKTDEFNTFEVFADTNSGFLNVIIEAKAGEEFVFKLIDLKGSAVSVSNYIAENKGKNKFSIEISSAFKGVYILNAIGKSGYYKASKVVIK